MDWFKNLNAAPKLSLSFGVLIALTIAISGLAIVNLSRANDRMQILYKQDMAGLTVADDLIIARLTLGEQARFTILNIGDASRTTAHEKLIQQKLSGIHDSLDQADKLFYLKEGKAILATIHVALPAYEKSYQTLIERVNAQDAAGAEAAKEIKSLIQDSLPACLRKPRAHRAASCPFIPSDPALCLSLFTAFSR
jgi:Four helix bundle sensory module for signal transduction